MHPLVTAVLLRMARLNALNLDAESEPPNRKPAESIQRGRCREGNPVVCADRAGEAEVLEGSFEDGKREFSFRRRQRLTRHQIPTGEVGNRERVTVPPIAKHELAFVIGTPQHIRF